MKITMTLLTLFALFSPITLAQKSAQLNLPEGAIARLGKGSLNEIQYSPDGARLAVATSIGIWLYDTMPLREVALFAGRHKGGVLSVAFSPDGRVLASGHGDGRIRLWDAKTGKLKRMLTGHNGGVTSVAFRPDGDTLASGGVDKVMRLWNANGDYSNLVIGRHGGMITSVAFGPDGRLAVGVWMGRCDCGRSTRGRSKRVESSGYSWHIRRGPQA